MRSSASVEQISSLASHFLSRGLAGLSAIAFHYPDSPASMALSLSASGLGSITFTSPRALQAPCLVRFLPHPSQQLHLGTQLCQHGECGPGKGKGMINRGSGSGPGDGS